MKKSNILFFKKVLYLKCLRVLEICNYNNDDSKSNIFKIIFILKIY